MTYRTSRRTSMTHHDPDSIYWSAMDSFSAENDRMRPISRQSISLNSRNYIDPWDLENYAYLQSRSLDSPESSVIPSPAGEPTVSSNFYYISGGNTDECPCYAGLEEQMFYNAKYELLPDDLAYSTYTDIESSSSTEQNSSCGSGSTVSTLQLHTPGFGVQSPRSIVLPKPEPQIEFPAPPPLHPSSAYEYYTNIPTSTTPPYDPHHHHHRHHHHHHRPRYHHHQQPQQQQHPQYYNRSPKKYSLPLETPCYECLDQVDHMPLYAASNQSSIDRRRRRASQSIYGGYATIDPPINHHLEKFGLSKKGLLQIDYSCNWNNLQRLITKQ